MAIKILLLNILFLLISGCAAKQDSLTGVEKHAISSSQLRLLMRELSSAMDDRHESELERDTIRRRYALRLSNNIEEFSSLLKNIQKKKLGSNIDEADMQLFSKYANDLEKKGKTLEQIAKDYELEKLNSAVNDIKRSCNTCHAKFRSY